LVVIYAVTLRTNKNNIKRTAITFVMFFESAIMATPLTACRDSDFTGFDSIVGKVVAFTY